MSVLEAKRAELTNIQTRILSVLPKGQENALPTSFLAEKAAIDQKKIRDVREGVSDLIFDHDLAIGSSSDKATRGIFLIENKSDLELAYRTLESRKRKIERRQKKLIENFYKKQQQALDLNEQE